MNRTLKETLTKLTLEIGGDWVTLLPFSLYRVRNSPYPLGLAPSEIMFGRPPPILLNLKSELIAEFDDANLACFPRGCGSCALGHIVHVRATYEIVPPPTPHKFQPGD